MTQELFWRPDANVDAARKLPEWNAFHRLCGKQRVYFDQMEQVSKRGGYRCNAFTVDKRGGGYLSTSLGTGTGATVLASVKAAYEQCGVEVPGAAEMLGRGLLGERVVVAEVDDEFSALLGAAASVEDEDEIDEFAELLK